MEINGEAFILQQVDQVVSFSGVSGALLTRDDMIDEFLRLFVCIKHLEKSQIDQLEGKLTGLRDQGESITLKLVSMEDAWKSSPDAKLLSSLALYEALKSKIAS